MLCLPGCVYCLHVIALFVAFKHYLEPPWQRMHMKVQHTKETYNVSLHSIRLSLSAQVV